MIVNAGVNKKKKYSEHRAVCQTRVKSTRYCPVRQQILGSAGFLNLLQITQVMEILPFNLTKRTIFKIQRFKLYYQSRTAAQRSRWMTEENGIRKRLARTRCFQQNKGPRPRDRSLPGSRTTGKPALFKGKCQKAKLRREKSAPCPLEEL